MHYEDDNTLEWSKIPLWLPVTFITCEILISILDRFDSFSLTRAFFVWLNIMAIAMIVDARKALKK